VIRAQRTCSVWQRSPVSGSWLAPLSNQALQRVHMKLDSKPAYEDSLVLWLQAGCWYADIRVNLASGEIDSGFGGVVWWQQPQLWFQHLINISGALSDQDIGDIRLTRFGCFEYGTFDMDGQAVCFEEKWQLRQSQFSRVYTRYRRGKLIGLEIQTDKHCILIIKDKIKLFARRGRTRGYGVWQTVHSNTPRENCWQPSFGLARPEWKLREVVSSA
jgi:hypothetical protein